MTKWFFPSLVLVLFGYNHEFAYNYVYTDNLDNDYDIYFSKHYKYDYDDVCNYFNFYDFAETTATTISN
jgi:hypothetical protein